MSPINRRDALKLLATAPFMGALEWTSDEVSAAALRVDALGGAAHLPVFFSEHEWRMVRILVDMIIPADDRSGSATDAAVPEFMDFIMNESSENRQRSMHSGLAMLDGMTHGRFRVPSFADASDAQRREILDLIAWPDRAPESLAQAVEFFNTFRDLSAAGFFSSRMGYEDLEFRGNEFVVEWHGCPQPALDKLGVSYDLMENSE